MNLTPSDQELEITAAASALLATQGSVRDRTDLKPSEPGADARAWQAFADQGWFGIAIPEDRGGVGLGPGEEALLFIELGRHLTPGPLLGSVLAAHVLAASGTDDVLLAGVLDGRHRVALIEPTAEGLVALDGAGAAAHLELREEGVVLRTPAGKGVLLNCIDPHVAMQLVDSAGEVLADLPMTSLIRERGMVLIAALLTGIAAATRDQSVDHVSNRQQFGRPLGTFQAVRHRCSDMAVRAEAARALTLVAALSLDSEAMEARSQALSALAIARDAAARNAADNLQNHGAMGFTAEHSAHLFVKRSRVLGTLLGGRRMQLDELAALRSPRQ